MADSGIRTSDLGVATHDEITYRVDRRALGGCAKPS